MVEKQINPEYGLDLSQFYKPHVQQLHVHNSKAHVKTLRIGRRWGKSRFALWEMIDRWKESLELPEDDALVPGFHAWIVCPSFPQARQVWNELQAFIGQLGIVFNGNAGFKQEEHYVELKPLGNRNYGLIEVKSAHNPDSLQTAGLDFLWVTESQDVSDRAFERLLPTLRSPGRMSYAVYEGIPSLYPTHWFERNYQAGLNGREGYESFSYTAFDNPLLDDQQKAEIEADKDLLPDRAWRRMYLAEFSEDAGYFSNISACIWGDELPGPLPGVDYVAGLDLGRKIDASVLTIMDSGERRIAHHVAWDIGADWVLQREGILRICKEWGLSRLVVDATGMGGDIFASELMEAGLPVEPFQITTGSREILLQNLAVSLERQNVSFPKIDHLLRELRAFQFVRLPSGRYRPEAPSGEHDDEVFALALALTACIDPPALVEARRIRHQSNYAPTQEDAENGNNSVLRSNGARLMRQRKIDRIAARQDEAGIT
mgnify:CR=1 FL=1|jgi:hypothetical protein